MRVMWRRAGTTRRKSGQPPVVGARMSPMRPLDAMQVLPSEGQKGLVGDVSLDERALVLRRPDTARFRPPLLPGIGRSSSKRRGSMGRLIIGQGIASDGAEMPDGRPAAADGVRQ